MNTIRLQKDGSIRTFRVKDDRVIANVKVGDHYVSNPTIQELMDDGWTEYVPPTPPEPEPETPEEHNAQMREMRKAAYSDPTNGSDGIFISWQKYLAQGDDDKAAQAHDSWLKRVQEIDELYPYIPENSHE